MSFGDLSLGTATTNRKHQSTYIHTSTVEDLSYTPSAREQTRDAAQIAATGRRSWKTLRGKGEAVWPPNLEAALIEALEKYKPDESRSSTSARFPLRNKFISDYIFELTGKRRTPKQVGSRLQQLRDTCKGERILELISHRPLQSDNDADSATVSSEEITRGSSSKQVPSTSSHRTIYRHTSVMVDLILESSRWSSTLPVVHLANSTGLSPIPIHLSALPVTLHGFGQTSSRSIPSSQLLRDMNPVISFASPYALSLQCLFSVFLEGTELPVHTEGASLKCHSSPQQSTGWVYISTLVPGFWKTLCNHPSPTQYSIVQQVVPSTGTNDNRSATISIIYRLSYPEASTKLENTEINQTVFNDGNFLSVYDPLPQNYGPLSVDRVYHGQHPTSNSQWPAQPDPTNHVSYSSFASFDIVPGTTPWYPSTPSPARSGHERPTYKDHQDGWTTGAYLAHPTPLAPAQYSYVPY